MATVTLYRTEQVARMEANGNIERMEIPYLVENVVSVAEGEIEALTAVKQAAPPKKGKLVLAYVEIEARESDSVYLVKAIYQKKELYDSHDNNAQTPYNASFDCGGGTRHIEKSLKQTRIIGDLNANNLINWNGKTGIDMDVRGLDLPTADIRESYTAMIRFGKLVDNAKYRRTLAQLVGKVNDRYFKGWQKGEVMYLGCSYSCELDKEWNKLIPVTFHFSIRPNETEVAIGGQTVDKEGFEYMWTISDTIVDRATGTPTAVITNAYKEQVAEYGNFFLLEIGD